jgi:hypothetical protein
MLTGGSGLALDHRTRPRQTAQLSSPNRLVLDSLLETAAEFSSHFGGT